MVVSAVQSSYVRYTSRKTELALLKRLLNCADNETSRYALNGIRFELDSHCLTYIATDGKCMAVVKDSHVRSNVSAAGIISKSWIVEQRAGRTDSSLNLELSPGDYLFNGAPAEMLEGRFPRWQDVLTCEAFTGPIVETWTGKFESWEQLAAPALTMFNLHAQKIGKNETAVLIPASFDSEHAPALELKCEKHFPHKHATKFNPELLRKWFRVLPCAANQEVKIQLTECGIFSKIETHGLEYSFYMMGGR